jgi:hypothetical protein
MLINLSAGKNSFTFNGTISIPLSTYDEYIDLLWEKNPEDAEIKWIPGAWKNYRPNSTLNRTFYFQPNYHYVVHALSSFIIE